MGNPEGEERCSHRRPPVSEPGEHKENQGEAATPSGVGQGRAQGVPKSVLAQAKDPG